MVSYKTTSLGVAINKKTALKRSGINNPTGGLADLFKIKIRMNIKNACPINLTAMIWPIGISLDANLAKTSRRGAIQQKPTIRAIPRTCLSKPELPIMF